MILHRAKCLCVPCLFTFLFAPYIAVLFYGILFGSGFDNLTSLPSADSNPLAGRFSSDPLITGDTFRAYANYIYDETRKDNLTSAKKGAIIFVKTDMVADFFSSAYKSIHNPIVIVTHNSDESPPNKYRERLEDSKILMWFASNPSEPSHPKMTPIPIGLANRRYEQGNLEKMMHAMSNHRKLWKQRTILLYVNFNNATNSVLRNQALLHTANIKDVQRVNERIPFDRYLEQIGSVKYVLSPPGNGLDCHRTWEALMMGAVPIVLRSTLDPLFKDTRSLIIDDWSKLTEEFLLSKDFSKNDDDLPGVVHAEHWRRQIFKYQ